MPERLARLKHARGGWAWVCMMGAVLSVLWAMAILGHTEEPVESGLPPLALAVVLFAAALYLRRPAFPRWPVEVSASAAARDNVLARGARAALAVVAAGMVIELSNQMQRGLPAHAAQLGFWLGGVALFVIAVTPRGAWASIRAHARASWRAQPTEWRILLLCTALALALRLLALEGALPLLFGDEAPFGRDTVALVNGARASLFAPGHQGHPWLFPALQAPFVSLFGRTLTAVRTLPALVGTLTVPATYLLARELAGHRAAAVAAAFLATYPVHVHFSRLGLNNIFDPLFGALAFGLLLRGLRRGAALAFALAGAALGLGQYFYSSGRLLLILMAGLLLWLALARWSLVRRHGRGLAVMLATAAVTVWPLFHHLYVHGIALVFRAQFTSVIDAPAGHIPALQFAAQNGALGEFVSQQVGNAFLGYIHMPDKFHFYGGTTAMLLPLAAVPFLLGGAWALWRWAEPPEALLLAWVALTALLGGALLTNPPGYARYVIVTPALAVLVGLGLVRTVDYLAAHAPARLRLPIPATSKGIARYALTATRSTWVTAALAALLLVVNVGYYFGFHLGDLLRDVTALAWETDDLRQRIGALPPDTWVYIFAPDIEIHGQAVVTYFAGDRPISFYFEDPVDWTFVLPRLERGQDLVLFFAPEQLDELDHVTTLLPGGTLRTPTVRLPRGVPYAAYRVWIDPES